MLREGFVKNISSEIMKKSKPIATTALISCFTSVSKEMKAAVSSRSQSPLVILAKIPTSFKRGFILAGQEMIENDFQNMNKKQE